MELKDTLFYKKKDFYETFGEAELAAAFEYAKGYASYLDDSKTEREAVARSIADAEKNGFVPYSFGMKVEVGGKYYYNNRDKNLFVFTIGKESLENGFRISAAHVDSPRIDLKPCPLYQEGGMSFFKTHYYGGIRKYQWVAIPLALHGVVVKADGTVVNVTVGEDDSDPLLYINDLLPHLGHADDRKPMGEAIPGEKLNVLVGSMPCGEGEDAIKLNVMKILNEKYGIVEEDFLSAELCVVPSAKARDVGLDRSMIGAYGHDDRVCAYPALTALFDNVNSEHSLMCILADKEETGSDGNTGMSSDLILDLIASISASLGVDAFKVRANSKCLSADVSAAYDPNFAEVFERRNAPMLSCGAILMKYTGSRGKGGTSDANPEFIGWLRGVLAKDNVLWQTGELGKVDIGGGGTVAKFIAKHNIDTVDLGVPVISMHAPYEIVSKVDVYETYRAFCAFSKY
ncbi:MAG: aminopeptidase [Clostridia bacterium]|nr:aminopeptidase [Clostridia bacterium]